MTLPSQLPTSGIVVWLRLVVQARMPSAAFPSWPAGGELSYSWNFCFHVPAKGGAGAVRPGQSVAGCRLQLGGCSAPAGLRSCFCYHFSEAACGGHGVSLVLSCILGSPSCP